MDLSANHNEGVLAGQKCVNWDIKVTFINMLLIIIVVAHLTFALDTWFGHWAILNTKNN